MILRGLMVVVVLFLWGCTEEEALGEVKRYIRHVQSSVGMPKNSIPTTSVAQFYGYSAETFRDPFVPSFVYAEQNDDDSPYPGRELDPLEKFGLNTLEMVGVVDAGLKRWALVRAPNGVVYRVTAGDFMGKNNGKVIHVASKYIDLMEMVRSTKDQKWEERPVRFKIRKNEQQVPICARVSETEELCVD